MLGIPCLTSVHRRLVLLGVHTMASARETARFKSGLLPHLNLPGWTKHPAAFYNLQKGSQQLLATPKSEKKTSSGQPLFRSFLTRRSFRYAPQRVLSACPGPLGCIAAGHPPCPARSAVRSTCSSTRLRPASTRMK